MTALSMLAILLAFLHVALATPSVPILHYLEYTEETDCTGPFIEMSASNPPGACHRIYYASFVDDPGTYHNSFTADCYTGIVTIFTDTTCSANPTSRTIAENVCIENNFVVSLDNIYCTNLSK